jgi:TfoX/Sxy family transcriptional regulator of competence genes
MARDRGLEELIADDLNSEGGIKEKAMFGGWAWLLDGKLFCGARDDGMLIRLGKGNDAWALEIIGIVPMVSGNRVIQGWVRADPRVYGDDSLRAKLLSNALAFVRSLPAK